MSTIKASSLNLSKVFIRPFTFKSLKPNSMSGFILLEALICLAILAILLPLAHKTFLRGWKNYQYTLLRQKAVQLANFELSKLETKILKGHFENWEAEVGREFSFDANIVEQNAGLKKISVDVRWQTSEGPQIYSLQEWIFSNPTKESIIELRSKS
jgi:type II secretory pathway pseudopilin PulG